MSACCACDGGQLAARAEDGAALRSELSVQCLARVCIGRFSFGSPRIGLGSWNLSARELAQGEISRYAHDALDTGYDRGGHFYRIAHCSSFRGRSAEATA
jgi:hypothetical protein